MFHWLEELNPEQRAAAVHRDGPLLILAGAGSGKTTVLVARTRCLIESHYAEPSQISVLTFTNKAARELKTRVAKTIGPAANSVWAGTFHSFGLMLLRKYYREAGLSSEFGIIDASDAAAICKELLKGISVFGKTAYDSNRLLSTISRWRESSQRNASSGDEYDVAVEWLLPRYLRRLNSLGVVDFDGLILKPIELLESSDVVGGAVCTMFDQMMVDEFQDTNRMQMRLIELVCKRHGNLTVVGDDDQSIYSWRGACVSNILDFPKRYPAAKVVKLERNYRCSPEILGLANSIIAKNIKRHAKTLKARDTALTGELPQLVVYDDEDEQAQCVASEVYQWSQRAIPKREIAVLYRSNTQGAVLEAEFRRQNIPYSITGGTAFFDRKQTRDALAYLRCAAYPNEIALRRVVNTPPRGIGERAIECLSAHASARQLTFYQALADWSAAGVERRAGAGIEEFLAGLKSLFDSIVNAGEDSQQTTAAVFLSFLTDIGYRQHVEAQAANPSVSAKQWHMLEVFAGILERYLKVGGHSKKALRSFIDAMELRDPIQDRKEDTDRVQLMTLHACKGLEFQVVFLIGLDDDVLPHKTLGGDLAEERRLLYVGVTRAKQHLYLTRVKKRLYRGKQIDAVASRFLAEIPKQRYALRSATTAVCEDRRKMMVDALFKKLDSLDARA